jgi:hypothetical protein
VGLVTYHFSLNVGKLAMGFVCATSANQEIGDPDGYANLLIGLVYALGQPGCQTEAFGHDVGSVALALTY